MWLNPYQAFNSQKVSESVVLVFKKKFYYNDAFVTITDPVYFNLLFCQVSLKIVWIQTNKNFSHEMLLSQDDILAVWAKQYNLQQPNFKSILEITILWSTNPVFYSNEKKKLKFIQPSINSQFRQKDLKFFLPADCLETWGITFQKLEKMIYKEHQKLRGIKEEYAKYRYLLLCRSLRTYGTVFFQAELTQHKGRISLGTSFIVRDFLGMTPIPLLLGVSRDCILLLYQKNKVFFSKMSFFSCFCFSNRKL